MRMVFQITKAELRNLFYSPVAWFLLIAFLAQCAWFYSSQLAEFASWQDIELKNNPNFRHFENAGFTRVFFLGEKGVFMNVYKNLYMFIPLLTMGLIGREVQSGTIRLLFSSPVKLHQIVVGKFMAIMVYNVLLLLVMGVFMISAAFHVNDVDYGMLLSAALGFYLLTCAFTAIGAFMSSLTAYQVVAAIGTFLIVFLLSRIGYVWQQFDFIRDLNFFLHMSGRAEKMVGGLITTKDLIYFVVIVVMFLAFTILKLKAAREKLAWHIKAMRYALVLIAGLMTGYISSRPALTGYWDTTAQKLNTIDPMTQQIIGDFGDEPLEVTLYTNLVGSGMQYGLPQNRNAYLHNMWDAYLRFKPDIRFSYEYYYDHDSTIMGDFLYKNFPGRDLNGIAKQVADLYEIDFSYWKKPAEMRQQIDLRPESLRTVMKLTYKGRSTFLRTHDDRVFWPGERQVAAALKRLVSDKIPTVAFLTGQYERSIHKRGEREYKFHTTDIANRTSMINYGFDIDTISPDHRDIPDNVTALVIADPKSALSRSCQEKIKQFLDKGGNLMLIGEPGKQEMTNPVLEYIGAKFVDGSILRETRKRMQDLIDGESTIPFGSMINNPSRTSLDFKKNYHVGINMEGAAPVTWSDNGTGFTARTLLLTPGKGIWLRSRPFVRDSAYVYFEPGSSDQRPDSINFPVMLPASYIEDEEQDHHHDHSHNHNHEHPDEKPAEAVRKLPSAGFSVGMAFYRTINGKDQRIVVLGDADWSNNTNISQSGFMILMHSWLTNGAFPVYIPKKDEPADTLLFITGKSAGVFKTIFVWIMPAALLLIATIILIRRKRK